MTPFQRIQVNTTSGSGISVYRAGDTGPQLFLVGGLQPTPILETPIAPVLQAAAAAGARVAMMDLTGSGHSFFRSEFTMELFVSDIRETFLALEMERSAWIGASMGGWLMLLIQERHPEWFRSMCALAPAIDWDENTAFRETGGMATLPAAFMRSMASHHILGRPFQLHAPLHIIHGEADVIALPDASRRLAAQAGARCTIEWLADESHSLAKLATPAAGQAFARWLRGELRPA